MPMLVAGVGVGLVGRLVGLSAMRSGTNPPDDGGSCSAVNELLRVLGGAEFTHYTYPAVHTWECDDDEAT